MRWYLGTIVILLAALVFNLGLLAYAMYVLAGRDAHQPLPGTALDRQSHGDARVQPARVPKSATSWPCVVTVRNRGRLPVAWTLVEDMPAARRLGAASAADSSHRPAAADWPCFGLAAGRR